MGDGRGTGWGGGPILLTWFNLLVSQDTIIIYVVNYLQTRQVKRVRQAS